MKLFLIIGVLVIQFAASSDAFSCDVTLPRHSPIVPEGAIRGGGGSKNDWYGSASLAALIPSNGQWKGMGEKRDYFNKFWWWRSGYDSRQEPHPDLVVSARRLDGPAEDVRITRVNSGSNFSDNYEWDSMLVGMTFPASGCWEVTGTYDGSETLTLVFWVGD